MQRLRLAAGHLNASPSLMALLQSDAGRARKAELFCHIELSRQEKGPQLVEVEGLHGGHVHCALLDDCQ